MDVSDHSLKLKGYEIGDLIEHVLEFINSEYDGWVEIRSLRTRFEIERDSTYDDPELANYKGSIQDIVYELVEKDNIYKLLEYLINKDNHEKYIPLLNKYNYTIENYDDEYIITSNTNSIFKKIDEKILSYIETVANNKTRKCLFDAKKDYGDGEFAYALSKCRLALESLAKNSFNEAIDELISKNIITEGNISKKNEVYLIKAIYGICSTLGSHTSDSKPPVSKDQAILCMNITNSIIHFLLKKLESTKKNNIMLKTWTKIKTNTK